MILHYDLFAGIGGFSLALENVYGKSNTKHIFIERDEFCQLVLKKHWPEAEYHSCIHEFIADAKSKQVESTKSSRFYPESSSEVRRSTILTGGFPCQPFSQAGRRKGTDDDRYLWPAMFESIKLIQPDWIIAENVAGLITWSEGMVLEQVCSDLESEDYEVHPFIIPACALNAPHRRDRVWIVANRKSRREWRSEPKRNFSRQSEKEIGDDNRNATDTTNSGVEGVRPERQNSISKFDRESWKQNWPEVATRLCGMDARIPRRLDRNPRLKALGNAIVPAVAEEIFKNIMTISDSLHKIHNS